MRLCLIAAKPTDAVTYGLLPAAARLGLEVFLLTDQPDTHAGVLARGRTDQGVQPRIIGCDVHDARALIGRIAGLPRVDAVFSNSDHLQVQTALAADYFGLPGKDWRSCLRAKNKPLMRRRLAETGAEKVTPSRSRPATGCLAGCPTRWCSSRPREWPARTSRSSVPGTNWHSGARSSSAAARASG